MTTGFPPETYGAAAAILRSYFDAARYNIGIIRADGDAARGSDFLTVEPKALFAALNHNVDGKNRHCIILSIAGRKRGLPVITDQMFAVHTDIIFATAMIATLRQGKRDHEGIGADFRGRLDTILCNSRLLAETFGHIERVTRDPDALLLILRAYGYAPTDAHFDKACEDAASLRLEQLIKNYEKAVVEAAREVVGLAIDREGMIERVGRLRTVAFPLPMDLPDEPGARILNEVWLPAKIAEPLMQKIIVGQAEAMAMRDTPTASGH